MARRVIGIDLGAYSVKLVRLLSGKQAPRFEVINVAEEIISHDEDDERDLVERQKEAIAKFSQMGLLEAEIFAIGLDASASQMRTMQVPYLDNRKLEAVLPGLLDAEVPFDIDEMVFSWHRVEDQVAALPAGEKPAFANIRVAFGKKQAIASTLQMLQSFSVNPRIMHLSSAVPFELVRELSGDAFFKTAEKEPAPLSAVIDFGHRATNLCIFDEKGLKLTRSFLRGGKKLTEEIAKALEISFKDAEKLKHEKIHLSRRHDEETERIINKLALSHHQELLNEIMRTFISLKTNGVGEIKSVLFIGGACHVDGFSDFFAKTFNDQGISILGLEGLVPLRVQSPAVVLAFALSLSCLQAHAKESRFNFRKDEFTWRGDLDFLRTNSTSIFLWGLVLVCLLTVMWYASSLVLDKESNHLEAELKTVCEGILGQKNVAPKKCLALMKEQITANVDVGIPDFAASDVFIKTAELVPNELKVTFSELDVSEKKVRLIAKTASFEDVDKLHANIKKIPCLVNVEKGKAQQLDGAVEFHLSSDIDCNAALTKHKESPR